MLPSPTAGATVQRATLADASAVRDIAELTFIETWAYLYKPEDFKPYLAKTFTIEKVTADLQDEHTAFWLVELDEKVIGFASAGMNSIPAEGAPAGAGEVRKFYLLKGYQGGGIGAVLFDQVMAWLQSNGPRTVFISVYSENHGALRFYSRRGFYKHGEYGYVVGNQVDREFIFVKTAEDFMKEAAMGGSSAGSHNNAPRATA